MKTTDPILVHKFRKAEEKAGQPGNIATPSDVIFLHEVLLSV